MTRASLPPILSELHSATSPASQVSALRALKNEIIGHEQRKEWWISQGILAPIARILGTRKGTGKKRHRDVNGTQQKQKITRNDEEEAKLQAILIVGSIAHGGPAYVSPIYANSIIPQLLLTLSPTDYPPYLILAALKVLNALADALCLSHPEPGPVEQGLLSLLYAEQSVSTLVSLLLQTSASVTTQQQIALTASLISKTCSSEPQRSILARGGVLEALAVCLTTIPVSRGFYLSSHNQHDLDTDLLVGRSNIGVSSILKAIAGIIHDSVQRAQQLQSIPALASLLQKQTCDFRTNGMQLPSSKNPKFISTPANNYVWRDSTSQSVLPNSVGLRSSSKSFPLARGLSSVVEPMQNSGPVYTGDEAESILVPWLVNIARTGNEVACLVAAEILASLSRFKLTRRPKETWFARLLVPAIVRMLDKDLTFSSDASSIYELNLPFSTDQFVKQRAPLVLAVLAANSAEVQRAAVDAGAIKKLSQLLKETYDDISDSASSMWAPEFIEPSELPNQEDTLKLGPQGLSLTMHHVLQVREGALAALAAIASDKDEYRKLVIDSGVTPFVIRTLKSEGADLFSMSPDIPLNSNNPCSMNNRFTVLAACGTVRAISRSTHTLRTSLMDIGLVAPLFSLLKRQDVELQTEATAVLANLILPMSPLREPIIEAGAVKILCEHAHSMNAKLRLNSIWALKHLVMYAHNELRMACLEELGPGWIKQIISNHPDRSSSTLVRGDDGTSTPIRMSTPNAAGEQVDLLNAVEEDSHDDSRKFEEDGDEDLRMSDSIEALNKHDQGLKQPASSLYQASFGTNSLKEEGSRLDSINCTQSLTDETAIQIQGLDFMRNLITHTGRFEMIDYIFAEFGQDKFFETLAAKLRPRSLSSSHGERKSPGDPARQIQPQTDLVISTTFLILHIAGGLPRQREVLISQTELLRLIVPLFDHPHKQVRINCVWIVNNLTWVDDESDRAGCKERARLLRNIGFCEKIEVAEKDHDLDIRERAKTARHQLSSSLR